MLEGIEAIVLRTLGDQCSLWESVLPAELQRLPEELARVDAVLGDPAFFAPFVPFFDPRLAAATSASNSSTIHSKLPDGYRRRTR